MVTETKAKQSTGLRTAAMVGAVAAVGMLATKTASAATLTFAEIPGTGDVKVLNYALSLEQLEANLYKQAQQRLTSGGTNDVGIFIPGLGIASSQPDVQYIDEFRKVEQEHRDFLTAALGAAAIKPFQYNFGIQTMTRQQVLNLVLTAEALGVHAYLGAIPYLQTRTYLQIAGAILGTEARHTAVITEVMNILYGSNLPVAPLSYQNNGRDTPLSPDTVYSKVAPFIVM